jgi:hypothetical protein
MSQTSMAQITPAVPADVIAYAAKHGVERCLLEIRSGFGH